MWPKERPSRLVFNSISEKPSETEVHEKMAQEQLVDRINTGLRADLHRLVRMVAADKRLPIKDVLDEIVAAGLKAQKSKGAK